MSVLEAWVGWLAPPSCVGCGLEGSAVCPDCATSGILPFGELCWNCHALSPQCRTCPKCRHLGAPSFVWINTNHEGLARDLVSLYKFGHQRAAAKPLSGMMSNTFLKFNGDPELQNYLVVPVPTATARVRQRGFGHAELLARHVAWNLKMEYGEPLRRLGQSRQLGATRETRLAQPAGNYGLKNPRRVAGRNILLVDDVLTTGGTLIAAAKTLRSAGARQVNALVFAKRL